MAQLSSLGSTRAMRFLHTTLLAVVSVFSLLYLIGFVRTVWPLRGSWEDEGFRIFAYPEVSAVMLWDGEHHAWGARHWMLFKVADFPTGEARVVSSFPSWYLSLPAVGILIYATFYICYRRRAA